MKKMKKAASLFLVLLMMLSMYACGNNTETPSGTISSDIASPGDSSSPTVSIEQPSQSAPVSDEDSKYGGILRIVLTAEGAAPLGLPWGNVSVDGLLQRPFLEALFYQMTVTGEIMPHIATSWELNESESELIIKLTPGVLFHDGTTLTAEVAGWNIMKHVEAHTANALIIGYEARDDETLVLKYESWSHEILSSLSTVAMCSKDAYEKNGEDWIMENPVGTGPFIMTEYIRGSVLRGKRNPNYWQEGKPYLDGIELIFLRDEMSQSMAIQTDGPDGIDCLNTNTAELAAELMTKNLLRYTVNAGPVTMFPSSNNPDSPLSKLEVRQAISYALNREAIVAARGFGIFTPATQFAPEGHPARLPDSYNVSYDLERAKALLAQAGYPDGFSTTLYTQPGSTDRELAVIIQSMLAEIGITAAVEYPDSGGFAAMRSGGWEGFLVMATRLFPRITSSYYSYFDANNLFMTSVQRPEGWAQALDYARTTPDIEQAAITECHRFIMENLMLIPIMDGVGNLFTKPNVHDTNMFYDERMNWVDAWFS